MRGVNFRWAGLYQDYGSYKRFDSTGFEGEELILPRKMSE